MFAENLPSPRRSTALPPVKNDTSQMSNPDVDFVDSIPVSPIPKMSVTANPRVSELSLGRIQAPAKISGAAPNPRKSATAVLKNELDNKLLQESTAAAPTGSAGADGDMPTTANVDNALQNLMTKITEAKTDELRPDTNVSSIYPISLEMDNKKGRGKGKSGKDGTPFSNMDGNLSENSYNSKPSTKGSIGSNNNNNNNGNNNIQIMKDDKGAISFKLPGRITHKTTIKLAHYPQPGSEVINIEQPIGGMAPPYSAFPLENDCEPLQGGEECLMPLGDGAQGVADLPPGNYSNNCNYCTYNVGAGQNGQVQNYPSPSTLMQHSMQLQQQQQHSQQQQLQSYYAQYAAAGYNNNVYSQYYNRNSYYPYNYNHGYGYGYGSYGAGNNNNGGGCYGRRY